MQLRKVNKEARAVLDKLTFGLIEPGAYRKIDNNPPFMPVNVSFLWSIDQGDIYSISHTYIQNGDVMNDPEMEFLRSLEEPHEYYPLSYRQDGLGIYQPSVIIEDGSIKGYRKALQRDQAVFAGKWMKNIKSQQGL